MLQVKTALEEELQELVEVLKARAARYERELGEMRDMYEGRLAEMSEALEREHEENRAISGSAGSRLDPDKLNDLIAVASQLPPDAYSIYFGQRGEDVVIEQYFAARGVEKVRYLDVGAFDPVYLSNTYRLYLAGGRGVLVEPNEERASRFRELRPEDTLLSVAIRTSSMPTSVNFYLMSAPTLNTIVAREAQYANDSTQWGEQSIEDVRIVPALTINEVLATHFSAGIDLLSIDIEGLDFEVLQEIDFKTYRPVMIVAEIDGGHYQSGASGQHIDAAKFVEFLKSKGYRLLLPSRLNGIFVSEQD